MPADLRDFIEAEAEKNNRSMNAEIVHRLELTRRFDLDVGESNRMRSEAGPVADYIDDKIAEVLLAIGQLRFQLEEHQRQSKSDDSPPFEKDAGEKPA